MSVMSIMKNLIVVVFGRAITGAVIGRAKGVGGRDDVVDVDLMLALSANMRSNWIISTSKTFCLHV